jgi:hypothetical protein
LFGECLGTHCLDLLNEVPSPFTKFCTAPYSVCLDTGFTGLLGYRNRSNVNHGLFFDRSNGFFLNDRFFDLDFLNHGFFFDLDFLNHGFFDLDFLNDRFFDLDFLNRRIKCLIVFGCQSYESLMESNINLGAIGRDLL